MAGDLSIGNLKATITLADQFSGPLDKVAKALGVSSKSLTAIGQVAGLAGAAIVGMTGAVVALGQRGAEVSDVQDAFSNLSERVGETSDAMIGGLQKATLGTISNFDLMKLANTALGSGLVKSAADMETLAGGAKLLADRTGGDTAKAFDTLTDAIAKGRTATLKQFGVFVDAKVAVEQYALAHHKSVSDLTDSERATALSAAALAALRKEQEKAGPAAADFGDQIARGKVAVQNFTDSLAVAIANSPAVAVGMNGIATALQNAFGGTQQQTVQTLTGYVNKFAIFIVQTAEVAVTAATFISNAWFGVQAAFNAIVGFTVDVLGKLITSFGSLAEAATHIPAIGDKFKPVADALKGIGGDLEHLGSGFKAQASDALDSAAKNITALDAIHAGLEKTESEMVKVSGAQVQIAASAPAAAKGVKDVGEAFIPSAAQVKAYEDSLLASITATDAMTANAAAQMESLQEKIAVLTADGLSRRLIEIQQAQDAEIQGLYTTFDVESAAYQAQAEKVREYYGLVASAAIDSANQQTAASIGTTDSAIADAERNLASAIANQKAILENKQSTSAQIAAADATVAAAEKKLDDEKAAHRIETFNKIADEAKYYIGAIFGKGKAASIATAIIDTAQAVVKALASAPPPLNYVLAAAVGAAGLVQINKIRSTEVGFASGTPGTSFVDFGRETSVPLHGPEAVVTPKQGASVAGMVEDALRAQDAKMVAELKGLRAEMADERRRLPLFMKSVLELSKA